MVMMLHTKRKGKIEQKGFEEEQEFLEPYVKPISKQP